MNINRDSARKILIVLVFVSFSIVPVCRTGLKGFIIKTDCGFPFNIDGYFLRDLSTYSKEVNFGNNAIHLVNYLRQKVVILPFYVLYKLGLSIFLVDRLVYVVACFLLMHGCYVMLRQCFRIGNALCAIVALFAVYNPFFILTSFSTANWAYLISYSAIFYIIAILNKLVERKEKKDIRILALWFVILSLNNYIIIITCFILILIFLYVFYSPKNGRRLQYFLKGVLLTLSIFIVVNMWLVLPQIGSLVREKTIPYEEEHAKVIGTISLNKKIYSQMTFTIYQNEDNPLTLNRTYNTVVKIVFVLFLIPVVLFLVLSRSRKAIWLFSCYLLFCFAAKGVAPPLGGIYLFLFNNVPFFSIYRDASHFLEVAVFLFIVLLGLALDYFVSRLESRSHKVSVFLGLAVLIAIDAYPLFSGNLLGLLEESSIPKDYYDVKDFLSGQKCRILFPGTEIYQTSIKYKWAPYETLDINASFFNVPIVSTVMANANLSMKRHTSELIDAIGDGNSAKDAIERKFRSYGVQYILLDFNIEDYHPLYNRSYRPYLGQYGTNLFRKGFRIYRFGNIQLVQIYEPFVPFIRVEEGTLGVRKYPGISVYSISVDDVALKGTKLRFSYSFDSNWRLYSKVEKVFEKVGKDELGFMEWEIGRNGDYVLFYYPDLLFLVGVVVCIVGIIFLSIVKLRRGD